MRAGGESLCTEIVGDGAYDEDQNGRDIVDDFGNAYPNVRSLSVVENFGFWGSKFARKLEHLEVASGNPLAAIRKPCPSFLELTFSSREEYPERGFALYALQYIRWANIGDAVESLTISNFLRSKTGVHKMKKKCKKIEGLSLKSRGIENDKIAEILSYYGSSLNLQRLMHSQKTN